MERRNAESWKRLTLIDVRRESAMTREIFKRKSSRTSRTRHIGVRLMRTELLISEG